MSMFQPIQAIIEAYDQPFFRKPPLATQNLFLQQQLSDWVHKIYFDQKKLTQLSVVRLIQNPLDSMKPTSLACSIMYSIIRQKVQEVCRYIRQMIMSSYRKLMLKKQLNCDLKHNSDSWNMNFYKFRKANLQCNMNKVYGPIAHIICTYHNSLLDSNKQVYDLWKFLYQCSQVKDLQFKALQSSLNQLILQQLMQDYPNNQMNPKEIMPTLSSFEKHQFIFKQMWGFQKRKLAVQFHPKNQQSTSNDNEKQKKPSKSIAQDPSMPRKVQKGKVLSPPKPIPISLKQVGVNTLNKKNPGQGTKLPQKQQKTKSLKQMQKKKALDNQIHLVELQQLVEGLDSETKLKIFKQVLEYKKDSSQKEKYQQDTIKHISKIILGNLSPEQKNQLQQSIMNSINGVVPIQIQISGSSDQSTEENEEINTKTFQDDNFIDEDQLLDDDQYINQLQKIKGNLIEQKSKELTERQVLTKQKNILSQVRQKLQKINQNLQKTITQYSNDNALANNIANYQNITISSTIAGVNTKEKQQMPELIPISSKKKVSDIQASNQNPIKSQKSQKPSTKSSNDPHKPSQIYSMKLQSQNIFDKQSLYQRLCKQVNELKELQQKTSSSRTQRQKRQHFHHHHQKLEFNTRKILLQKQSSIGRNFDLLNALSKFDEIKQSSSNKQKSLSQSLGLSFIPNSVRMSSKLQKMSQQQIVDQIYEIAKQKQKRGNFKKSDIKLTYKKISYQLKSGDQRNQIKITKGSITADDFQTGSWFQQSQSRSKYQLNENFEFGQKLIDQPNEQMYPNQDKQQKKKKKKKKKKNKNSKKQGSDQNNEISRKNSISSFNDQQDLQTLQEFRKKASIDIKDFKQILGWEENDIKEVLEKSQILQRMRQHEILMEKKLEIYQKNGERNISKDTRTKKEILNQEELKVFKFLQSLQIRDQNRQKCVITQQTMQKFLYKRKEIKSKQMFQKLYTRPQHSSLSVHKNQEQKDDRKNDLSNPKAGKPKNKKKKK